MTEKKYEHLINREFNRGKDAIGTLLFQFNKDIIENTPFFTDVAWIWPKKEKIVMEGESHSHDFDEIVTLFGTNPDDTRDLCGEVEFWIEDEKYELTNSCLIFIPKGTRHCPIIFHKVERPIFHFIVGQAGKYGR
ncbi:MAG: hypothetical protein JXL81_07390 [Deltaproteobacteria bacterium]|nr:hypothetical protein [Deltaproteobacteria bacterium]